MRKLILALMMLFLVFGCIEQKSTTASPSEVILSNNQVDFDQDGVWDYSKFDFSSQKRNDLGLDVRRTLIVSPKQSYSYSTYNSSISDIDRLMIDNFLDDFESTFSSAYSSCANNMGVSGVTCTDSATCFNLCRSSSTICRRIPDSASLLVGNSIRSFSLMQREITRPLNQMRSDIYQATSLSSTSDISKSYGSFMEKVSQNARTPAISIFNLCDPLSFDSSSLRSTLSSLGSIESNVDSYDYLITLSVTSAANSQVQSLEITDLLPSSAIIPGTLNSISEFEDLGSGKILINQTSKIDSQFITSYQFSSPLSPDEILPYLTSPKISVSKTNLQILSPLEGIYAILQGPLRNSALSSSLSIAITLIMVMIAANFLSLFFNFATEKPSSMRFANSIRRAFGKVGVNWKNQVVLGVFALICAYAISTTFVPGDLLFSQTLTGVISNLLKSEILAASILIGIFGFVTIYFAIENLLKLSLLERAYGIAISQEKDLYLASASNIADKFASLTKLVDSASSLGIEANSESELLSRISLAKISELASTFNPKNKATLSEWGEKIDEAISSVSSKISSANDNWSKWESYISSMVSTSPHLTLPMLVSIPPSLRTFAVSKYVRAHSNEVTFEGGVLTRKKLSYDSVISEMVKGGYIKGGILLRNEKPFVNLFSEDGGTVNSVLSLKIRSSAIAFSKSLLNKEPSSFVVVCENIAITYLRNVGFDAILFMEKDKYKDSVDMWKVKSKMVEG